MKNVSLTNQFLIAMPSLQDPYFQKTVTYICEHNEEGAIGFIINRPTTMPLDEVFKQMNLNYQDGALAGHDVLFGGPVQPERGFVLHRTNPETIWRTSSIISHDISVTTSRDILESIAEGKGPNDAIVMLGCAGWGADQLEQEILNNSWLNCEADASIIFDTPYQNRWKAAAQLLGIDIEQLSDSIGHG